MKRSLCAVQANASVENRAFEMRHKMPQMLTSLN